ncbi:MAG: Rho-binding antiterminator [Fibrobacteria bacterium]
MNAESDGGEGSESRSGDAGAYRPIACDFHDQLEAYATTRRLVRLSLDSGATTEGRIADFRTTASKEEFLMMQDGSAIRLDKIAAARAID